MELRSATCKANTLPHCAIVSPIWFGLFSADALFPDTHPQSSLVWGMKNYLRFVILISSKMGCFLPWYNFKCLLLIQKFMKKHTAYNFKGKTAFL